MPRKTKQFTLRDSLGKRAVHALKKSVREATHNRERVELDALSALFVKAKRHVDRTAYPFTSAKDKRVMVHKAIRRIREGKLVV